MFEDLTFIFLSSTSCPSGQAEFQNVIESVSTFSKALCLSASISWNLRRGESQESSFVLGFNSDTPQLNSSKVYFVLRFLPIHFMCSCRLHICSGNDRFFLGMTLSSLSIIIESC